MTFTERNAAVIETFRANGGKVDGWTSPLLLMTTKGAKSGEQRTSPMAYLPGDGVLYVFASKAGAPVNPAWYHNLVANPDVSVEVGSEAYEATATPLPPGEERDKIWAQQVAISPGFAEYQAKVERLIPVVAVVKKG